MLHNFFLFLLKNKRIVFVVFILFLIFFLINSTLDNKDSANKTKGETPSKLTQDIKNNIKKYQPKDDWQKKHPSDMGLTAKSALVLDQNTGQIIYSKNEHEKLPPASITKILTLVVVLENLKTDQLCPVSEKAAATQPNKITMETGEKMKVDDLLYGLMMISANDAAEVLAECYDGGRDKFIKKMNEKIHLLGLKDSLFKDPSGLNDIDQLSSSFDLATVTRYALLTQPNFLKYVGRKDDYSVYPTDHNESHSWYQISHLLSSYPGMEGAKTGYTYEAKNTYVGIAKRNDRRIIIVYFAAETTTSDATTLLEYGFSNNPNI